MIDHPDARSALCPPWCTGVHELGDDLTLTHRSEPRSVPAVERAPAWGDGPDIPSTVEMVLGLECSGGETWVWIGPGDDAQRAIVLSVESAARLARALTTLTRGARLSA